MTKNIFKKARENTTDSAMAKSATHVKNKKWLGQNFLKSIPALKKIVEAGEISKKDTILEIGPGKGALTEKLLEKADRIIAVEKDLELFEFLKEKFSKQIATRNLVLVHGDILNSDMSKIPFDICRNYKIIANIPYNITGAILKKFLTEKNQPSLMVLMVQNEVGRRIMSRDGKESILSISVKVYGEPNIVMKVPARYFSPAPKVDSAIVEIKNISRNIFLKNNVDEKKFWEIVRAGFAHKRKKLSSNLHLRHSVDGQKDCIEKQHAPETYVKDRDLAFVLINTLGNKRAEELTLAEWISLAKMLNINKKQ